MIYNCTAIGCNFSAFNEKALALHKKEKHREIPTPPSQEQIVEEKASTLKKEDPVVSLETAVVQGEKQKETRGDNPQNNKQSYNFMLDLKGKRVTAEGINGKKVTGLLKMFNQYELNIDTEDGNRTLFKHSLFMIWEQKKEEAEAG